MKVDSYSSSFTTRICFSNTFMTDFDNFWVAEYNKDSDLFHVTTLRDALTNSCENMMSGKPLWTIVYIADSTEKVDRAIEKFKVKTKKP